MSETLVGLRIPLEWKYFLLFFLFKLGFPPALKSYYNQNRMLIWFSGSLLVSTGSNNDPQRSCPTVRQRR